MKKKPSGLGKGLGALLGEEAVAPRDAAVTLLPVQQVEPDPNQPRKDFDPEALQALADSIAEHGVIQPLAVRKIKDGCYRIIAGERRWRAARLAGLREVPVCVLEADDRTVAELSLVENLQREDLNPMEEAQGYARLIDEFSLTQEQVADRVGKSRPAVANALRLLSLSGQLAGMVRTGELSAGHARALLRLPNEAQRLSAAQRVIALQLSVRQTESLCKTMLRPPAAPKPDPNAAYVAECEKDLSRRLGRKVRIVNGEKKGRFELEFYGQDDLNRLLFALKGLKIKEEPSYE